MRLKINYMVNGQPVEEQGQLDNFPAALMQWTCNYMQCVIGQLYLTHRIPDDDFFINLNWWIPGDERIPSYNSFLYIYARQPFLEINNTLLENIIC